MFIVCVYAFKLNTMDGWTEILFRQTKIVAVHITTSIYWISCSICDASALCYIPWISSSTHSMCMKQLQWSETSPANNNNNEWNVKSNCGCGIFFFVYAEFNVFRFIIILRMHANQTLWHCYWTFQTPTTPIRSEMVYTHSFHFLSLSAQRVARKHCIPTKEVQLSAEKSTEKSSQMESNIVATIVVRAVSRVDVCHDRRFHRSLLFNSNRLSHQYLFFIHFFSLNSLGVLHEFEYNQFLPQ